MFLKYNLCRKEHASVCEVSGGIKICIHIIRKIAFKYKMNRDWWKDNFLNNIKEPTGLFHSDISNIKIY